MDEELYDLPKGWVWTTVNEIIEIIDYRGRTPPFSNSGIPHLRSSNVKKGKIIWEGLAFVSEETYQEYMTRGIPQKGDILFTTEAPLGEVALAPDLKFSLAQRMMVLRPSANVLLPLFLLYQIASELFQTRLNGKGTGTTVKGISSRNFKHFKIILPPLPEQHRIVAKIEELFTEVDAGVELLKKLKLKLKRYRQAVLKAAVEGNLTKEWREANQGKLEPASMLRDHILKQRREKWEAEQLAKMKAQGKTPKDDSWKLKYKEPVVPDTSDLPELPERWCWVTMEILTTNGPQNGIYLPKSDYGSGIPILRIDDFQDNFSRSSSELNLVNATTDDIEKYSLSEGDLVINRVNSPSHLGKCLVVTDKHFPALFESNMMRLHLSNFFEVSFAAYYLRSVHGKSRLISNAKWAVNQASINQTDVGNTPVPLLPVEEQKKIIAEVELNLSVIEKIEKIIDANLKRAKKLRQSILKQAFEGKLIPQDPNDEPAEKLLERIKAEKAKHEAEKKPKRQSTTKSSQPRKSQTTAIQLELNFDD